MGMSKHDRIIGDLVNALAAIRLGVEHMESLAYLDGIAEQAIKNCRAQQQRNKDGYLVTIDDGGPAFPTTRVLHWTEIKQSHAKGEPELYTIAQSGMSLRAYIATRMFCECTNPYNEDEAVKRGAIASVRAADALIAALKGGA